MMNLRHTAFLLCLFMVCTINGASKKTITLTVIDKTAESPLANVKVSYSADKSLRDATVAITDIKGHATMVINDGAVCYYHLQHTGYMTAKGRIEQDVKVLTVKMEEDVFGLEEVVVTGSRTERPLKLSPITTQVLGGKALVETGYANLQQALQQETPGLNFHKVGFGTDISMQGLDARHVLFLQDGERMTGEIAGNLDYERFNIHSLDRIEIVKGASSTLYGSRASGAVINLISKKTSQPLSIDAGIRYGQMNQHNYHHPSPEDFQYMFEKNSDRPNLQSWMSAGLHQGAFTSQTDVWYSESDGFYLYQKDKDVKLYTKEANPFLPHDIRVTSTEEHPPLGIEGTEHISVSQKLYYEPNTDLSILAYGSMFFMNSYDMLQDMTFSQSKDWTGGIKANYQYKNYFKIGASIHGDFYDRYKRHERVDTRQKIYKSKIIQPRFTISTDYLKGHDIIFGIENTYDDLTSDRFVNLTMSTRTLKELEYFIQDEWTANERITMSTGIRTNFSKNFGFMWMPKIAIKYSPDDNWSFRANYSMGYRSPSIKELYFNWDMLGMFQIRGNEELNPEKNNYFSIGTEYSNDRLFVSVNTYANLFRDKIEGVWHIYDMQYNFEYTNIGHQTMAGIEAIGRWKVAERLTFNGTYSYVYVSKNNGVQVNSTSPHAATAGLNYRYSNKGYKLSAIVNASLMGKKTFDVQDRVYVNEEKQSYDAYFRCKLPSYMLCNASVSQTFDDRIRVTLGVDNIFNYKPKTLGAGITMFNIPATAGTRGHIQVEFDIDELMKLAKKKK
jgi:outer membrane receptor for ferrienterochelin and colicins